jgi:hypothetical protein
MQYILQGAAPATKKATHRLREVIGRNDLQSFAFLNNGVSILN